MSKRAKPKLEPCDCPVEKLAAERRDKWDYLPWVPTFGWIWCRDHRLWVGITHDAIGEDRQGDA